jgi:hypothetical protein
MKLGALAAFALVAAAAAGCASTLRERDPAMTDTATFSPASIEPATLVLRSYEGNQELFVLTRDDERSDWQISRYIFSTTQPRQG